MAELINPKDPVVESLPGDWTSEQELIAKEAAVRLQRHYPGYRWGVEWTNGGKNALGCLYIRILDLPADVGYLINPKDIDRDNMRCVMRAGGEMLEAFGLRVGKARGDDVRGLKRTPAGLIVPNHAAVPETNPGYEKIKAEFTKLNG